MQRDITEIFNFKDPPAVLIINLANIAVAVVGIYLFSFLGSSSFILRITEISITAANYIYFSYLLNNFKTAKVLQKIVPWFGKQAANIVQLVKKLKGDITPLRKPANSMKDNLLVFDSKLPEYTIKMLMDKYKFKKDRLWEEDDANSGILGFSIKIIPEDKYLEQKVINKRWLQQKLYESNLQKIAYIERKFFDKHSSKIKYGFIYSMYCAYINTLVLLRLLFSWTEEKYYISKNAFAVSFNNPNRLIYSGVNMVLICFTFAIFAVTSVTMIGVDFIAFFGCSILNIKQSACPRFNMYIFVVNERRKIKDIYRGLQSIMRLNTANYQSLKTKVLLSFDIMSLLRNSYSLFLEYLGRDLILSIMKNIAGIMIVGVNILCKVIFGVDIDFYLNPAIFAQYSSLTNPLTVLYCISAFVAGKILRDISHGLHVVKRKNSITFLLNKSQDVLYFLGAFFLIKELLATAAVANIATIALPVVFFATLVSGVVVKIILKTMLDLEWYVDRTSSFGSSLEKKQKNSIFASFVTLLLKNSMLNMHHFISIMCFGYGFEVGILGTLIFSVLLTKELDIKIKELSKMTILHDKKLFSMILHLLCSAIIISGVFSSVTYVVKEISCSFIGEFAKKIVAPYVSGLVGCIFSLFNKKSWCNNIATGSQFFDLDLNKLSVKFGVSTQNLNKIMFIQVNEDGDLARLMMFICNVLIVYPITITAGKILSCLGRRLCVGVDGEVNNVDLSLGRGTPLLADEIDNLPSVMKRIRNIFCENSEQDRMPTPMDELSSTAIVAGLTCQTEKLKPRDGSVSAPSMRRVTSASKLTPGTPG